MIASLTSRAALIRLLACLAGGVVLAAMWGPAEGSTTNYYYELNATVWQFPRILFFLALGVLAFLVISFRSYVVPYVTRPGVTPLAIGLMTVVAGQVLMHWNDQVGDAKFGAVANAVARTAGLPYLTSAFYGWLHWTQFGVTFGLCALAIVLRWRVLGWVAAALSVFAAYVAYKAHQDVAALTATDHSLGYAVTVTGYVVMAGASVVIALSQTDTANTRAFVNQALGWRPGFPLAVLGGVVGLLSFTFGRWYAPNRLNTTLAGTHTRFTGTDLNPLASAYLAWLAWVLLLGGVAVTVVAALQRSRVLGWVGAAVGAAGCAATVFTLYKMSSLAAQVVPTDGTTWQNLGAGGWMASAAFLLLAGAGLVVATATRGKAVRTGPDTGFLAAPGAARSAVIAAVAFAVFYPPTMNSFWQQVLVTEIGVYLLLTVGLNVVVGWAGLLDLGYIAFFAVGSYSTAYLTNSLPVKPPSWLVLPPLAAIPFAIVIAALAGLILGAPTLRLRGDYLAIVTLGFGEIIHLAANNADGITNGSRGTTQDPTRHVTNVPHPTIHVGPVHVSWGLNQLQYWYLLLIYLVIVVIAFRRLEHSRVGRAWAAIREDEVAAEASGVNTFRIKLLAFSIGASTSGVAGVFYASQIGYISPTDFVLNFSILVVAYVVFGGMGSLTGALAGAAALTWLPEFLKDQVPSADRQMWIGAIVVAMMIFRPAGLVPAKRRRIELAGGLDETPNAETLSIAPAGAMGGVP